MIDSPRILSLNTFEASWRGPANCSDGEAGKSQPMNIDKVLRRELKNWFGSLEPQLFVTHNFGFRVSPETGERSLRRFYNRLQSRVQRRNWYKRVNDQPMVAVGLWEHLDSNRHCHVLISASDDESAWLLGEGEKSWLWLQPRGQFDISEIESLPNVISYVAKEIYKPDSLDQLFVYKAPPSNSANSNSVEPPRTASISLPSIVISSPSKWL